MKKTAGILICLLILAGLLPAAVSAQSRLSGAVFVSIADQNGTPVLAYEKVSLSDMDRDGTLTVNDVLMAAHKEHHRDGKEGFSSEKTQYGRSITKLWGVENGGSYGCFVNDVSCTSCNDPIRPGDHLYAYIYTDTVGFSDTYSYFDRQTLTVNAGEPVTLTLSCVGYDASWNPVTEAVAGAVILFDGEETEFVTDENGSVTLVFESGGDVLVSARADTKNLTPAVCRVSVNTASKTTMIVTFSLICCAVAAAGFFVMIKRSRHA
ncbi:MAG: hypothetical protein IKM00_03895 [Clostridia bacterium]|nr:hypothetical protein [Clostridia bacterium]